MEHSIPASESETPPKSTLASTEPARGGTERTMPGIPGYQIIKELGRGGMCVVYEARQLKLNRTVALKMILAGEHAGEKVMARFLAEAEIAAGLQHAHMSLVAVAESSDDFERWLTAQRAPAPEPQNEQQARGRDVVERGPCAMCHSVRGTIAGGRTAPDLTHVASRSTIGAGTAPNTPGYLAGWIVDPQHLKPGNRMPAIGLPPADLQAVLTYVESLK